MHPIDWTDFALLADAERAAQKLEKKLRQARNAGQAADVDVADAKAAVASLRAIAARHGVGGYDLDSRAEKKHRRQE